MKNSIRLNASLLRWTSCLALVTAVTACGGGGGGSGDAPSGTDPVNNANAVDDAFPAIQSAAGGSTTPVQANDTVTINGTTTAAVLGANSTITSVTRTSAAPAAGSINLNASTGIITVAPGTSAGAYAFSYQLCRTAPDQAVCDLATASGTVTATPPASDIVTRADVLACAQSASIINSTNWSNCLVGKRLVGVDSIVPSQACELRFLANGSVEYTHNGASYVPSAAVQANRGSYQNTTGSVGVQLLQGSLNWDLSGSATRNRVSAMSVTINLQGADLVEVEYFDPALVRRNLNCSLANI